MDKLDINDVYYCIPILEEHQKLLKFKYSATLYKFIALSSRYTEDLRKFTKTLNTALALIHKGKLQQLVILMMWLHYPKQNKHALQIFQ